MPEPLGDLRPYVVQVLNPLGGVEGTGFLCHPDGYVLTCWHVIEPWKQAGLEKGLVLVQGEKVHAEWVLAHSVEAADLAVLKLSKPVESEPEPWPYLPLDVHWRVRLGEALDSFGYPAGQFEAAGIPFSGEMGGLTPTRFGTIEAYPIVGLNLENVDRGYSGAPVVNHATQKVVGLTHAKHREQQAFIVPLTPLFAVWPEVQAFHDVFEHIRRRLGEEAQAKLDKMLHDAPYVALSMECGEITTKSEAERGSNAREYAHGREWKAFDLKELLPPHRTYVLSSDVGTGKTTFVYRLAADLVRRTRKVPIVMNCQELERLNPKSRDDVLAGLAKSNEKFLDVDLAAFIERAQRKGELVFLFDGLDQIQGNRPSDLAKLAFKIAGKCQVILTSRPSAVLAIETDSKLAFLRLQPFSPQDQRRYFGEDYPQAKAACSFASDLAQVPMLTYMVRKLVRAGEIKQAATRTELYQAFLHHILATHEPNRPIDFDDPDRSRLVQTALKGLAFQALAQPKPDIQKVPIRRYPEDARVPLKELTTFGLVNRICDQGEKALFFTHQSFQEFLAAQYAADTPQDIDRILSERWNPKWAEVIRFLAGMLGREIIEKILAEGDDVIHSNTFLAARCLSEVKNANVGVVDPVKTTLLSLADTEPFRFDALAALGGLGKWCDSKVAGEMAIRLDDEDPNVRCSAIEALGGFSGRVDAKTMRAVEARLDDDVHEVRSNAARALVKLSERVDAETVLAIAARLDDAYFGTRFDDAWALDNLLGRVDAETVLAIAARLNDDDPEVRSNAVRVLGKLSERVDAETVQAIAARLGDNNPDVRSDAARALVKLSERVDAETVLAIAARLDHDDPEVRSIAVRVLGEFSERVDAETVIAIAARLDDDVPEVCFNAIIALGEFSGRVDTETVRAITARLDDEDRGVRFHAAEALVKLSERVDAETVLAIAARLDDAYFGMRSNAAWAMDSLLGRVDAEMVRDITARLDHEDPEVRSNAVRLLGKLSERVDSKTVRAVAARLDDDVPEVRCSAIEALGGFSGRVDAETVRAVAARLDDDVPLVRSNAASALVKLSERVDAETVLAIAARLDDDVPLVRSNAASALVKLSERVDAETVLAIAARLDDDVPGVRYDAVRLLGEFSERVDAETVRAVAARLDDDVPEVRCSAIEALGGFSGRVDAETVRAIVARLKDDEPVVHYCAIEALGKLSERLDAETVRAIAAHLIDESPGVQFAAAKILGELSERVDAETIGAIATRLYDRDLEMRERALRSLQSLYAFGCPIPQTALAAR